MTKGRMRSIKERLDALSGDTTFRPTAELVELDKMVWQCCVADAIDVELDPAFLEEVENRRNAPGISAQQKRRYAVEEQQAEKVRSRSAENLDRIEPMAAGAAEWDELCTTIGPEFQFVVEQEERARWVNQCSLPLANAADFEAATARAAELAALPGVIAEMHTHRTIKIAFANWVYVRVLAGCRFDHPDRSKPTSTPIG